MKIDWNRVEERYSLIQTLRKENLELKQEIERLQKENQILMNSMVTEAHTKETRRNRKTK